MTELKAYATQASGVAGLHDGVIVRSQQSCVGIIEGLQHGFDGAVGLLAGFDRLLESLLSQTLPMNPVETRGVDIALIHQSPGFHHQLLGIVESQSRRWN